MQFEKRRTFYFSTAGNDENDGLSEQKPKKSIIAIGEIAFVPGDRVLFEAGSVFQGNLTFKNVVGPFFLGSYGAGQATICSGNLSGVVLEKCKEITLAGLKFEGEGWRKCNSGRGVHVVDSERVLIQNIEVSKYHKAGIACHNVKNLKIYGCFAHDNGGVGIATGANNGVFCEDVHIAYCKTYDNAGDPETKDNHSGSGIIIAGSKRTLVEFCEAAGNGWGQRQINVNGPVGMWCCCGCTDIIFRWCISRYNRTQPGTVDGDGLDIDGEVENGVLEYNYTYGNEGSGYLLCEFWGETSDVDWKNNVTRYCVSFEDATRVSGYGPINISSPEGLFFEDMFIENCLFVANKNLHSVYNRYISHTSKNMNIKNNVLVTDGTDAIEDPANPNVEMADNIEMTDERIRQDIIEHAPLLTNPRDLLNLPVFEALREGICAPLLKEQGAKALFGPKQAPKLIYGKTILTMRMDGLDLEGSDYSGDVLLWYDSIKPGVSTRLATIGSQFYTPIPWWTKDKNYLIRAKARIQSPDTVACLFLRHKDGSETKEYFSGTVAEYTFVEIRFVGTDKWYDQEKYIGVRHEGGRGAIFVDSLELVELSEEKHEEVAQDELSLSSFRQSGDCFEKDRVISLYGTGSGIAKTLQSVGRTVTVDAFCNSDNGEGVFFLKCGKNCVTKTIKDFDWAQFRLELVPDESKVVEFGIWNDSNDPSGTIFVKNISLGGLDE